MAATLDRGSLDMPPPPLTVTAGSASAVSIASGSGGELSWLDKVPAEYFPKFGLRQSPDDVRDWKYSEHISAEKLALVPIVAQLEDFDLRDHMEAVRNQNRIGACACFAGAVVSEYRSRMQQNKTGHMSPDFIYLNRKTLGQMVDVPAMFLRDVMQILKRVGTCPEKLVSKVQAVVFGAASLNPEMVTSAEQHRISAYARIYSPEELKLALVCDGPVVASFKMYNFGKRMWKQVDDTMLIGPHTMNVIGWNKKGFVVRNSWGHRWGDGGYTIYPYEDWTKETCGHFEMWAAIDSSVMTSQEQLEALKTAAAAKKSATEAAAAAPPPKAVPVAPAPASPAVPRAAPPPAPTAVPAPGCCTVM